MAKLFLPFWFVRLRDGQIPEIRFTKHETNLEIKNWKKYLASLFVIKINPNSSKNDFDGDNVLEEIKEDSWIGHHRSSYKTNRFDEDRETFENISNNENSSPNQNERINLIQIIKHISNLTEEKDVDSSSQNDPRSLQIDAELDYNRNQTIDFDLNQTITLDRFQSSLINLGKFLEYKVHIYE